MNLRSSPGAGTLAVAALGSALWVEHCSRQAERHHHAPHQLMHLGGMRLHYQVVGNGPPVLLVHGNLVDGADWEASGLVDRLAQRYRVLVIDRPGFGFSDRPRDEVWTPARQARLFRHACATLGLHRPVVVGHSLGAQVALCMALQDPLAIAGLVLVSGYYWPSLRLDRWMAAPLAAPLLGDVLRYTTAAWTARASLGPSVRAMFHPRPVPEAFARLLPRELLLRPLQQRATAEDSAHMVAQARALREQYANLHLPVTLIAGTQDGIVAPQQSVRLLEHLSLARLRLLDGLGHMAHYDAHPQILAGIEEALGAETRASGGQVAPSDG